MIAKKPLDNTISENEFELERKRNQDYKAITEVVRNALTKRGLADKWQINFIWIPDHDKPSWISVDPKSWWKRNISSIEMLHVSLYSEEVTCYSEQDRYVQIASEIARTLNYTLRLACACWTGALDKLRG